MLFFIYFLPEVLVEESPVHFVKLLSLRCLKKMGVGMAFNQPEIDSLLCSMHWVKNF